MEFVLFRSWSFQIIFINFGVNNGLKDIVRQTALTNLFQFIVTYLYVQSDIFLLCEVKCNIFCFILTSGNYRLGLFLCSFPPKGKAFNKTHNYIYLSVYFITDIGNA